MPTKNDNSKELEEAQKLKRAADIDILAVIEQRVKTIEEEGYPTEEVLVPLSEAYVLVHKIKKIKDSILPANLDFDSDETKAYVESKKAEIESLQKQIKDKSYKFIMRGFASDVYEDAMKAEVEKKKTLKEGEELEFKDSSLMNILIASIDSYALDDKLTKFSELSEKEKIDFILSLDSRKQLPLLDKAISSLILSSADFENAITDISF
jgi:hypothetical protein